MVQKNSVSDFLEIPYTVSCMEVGLLRDPDLFRRWLERMPELRRQKVNAMRFEEGRCLSLGAGILLDRALAKRGVDGGIPFQPEPCRKLGGLRCGAGPRGLRCGAARTGR